MKMVYPFSCFHALYIYIYIYITFNKCKDLLTYIAVYRIVENIGERKQRFQLFILFGGEKFGE